MDPTQNANGTLSSDTARMLDTEPFLRQEGRRPAVQADVSHSAAEMERSIRRMRAVALPEAGGAERASGHSQWMSWLVQRLRPNG